MQGQWKIATYVTRKSEDAHLSFHTAFVWKDRCLACGCITVAGMTKVRQMVGNTDEFDIVKVCLKMKKKKQKKNKKKTHV